MIKKLIKALEKRLIKSEVNEYEIEVFEDATDIVLVCKVPKEMTEDESFELEI